MYGTPIIRGYVDGVWRTAIVLWRSHGRIGVTWGARGSEAVWVEGRPGPRPYDYLKRGSNAS